MRYSVFALLLIITLITSFPLMFFPIKVHAQVDCDSSYPDVCIPSYPPDLNCPDISDDNFRVVSPDPHGFDREGDGIGCES
jgi:micrococcal nuclease